MLSSPATRCPRRHATELERRVPTWVLLVCLAVVVACDGTAATPAQSSDADDPSPVTTEEARFLALGDSYTIGEGVEVSARWPVQLAERLRQGGVAIGQPEIIARSGWTTAELSSAIEVAGPAGPYELVTLMVGVNDQFRGRPVSTFRSGLASLLTKAVALAGGDPSRVVVLSIPDWGVTPFAAGRDRASIAAEIDSFNEAVKAEADRVRVHYVDVTPASRRAAADRGLLASDGLHPSGDMYQSWVGLVLPVARNILGSE